MNVEVKARVSDPGALRARVAALASSAGQLIDQVDTFFAVPRGRLKVRRFSDGTGELIAYERADHDGPRESVYNRVPCRDAAALSGVLGAVLPVRGDVSKRRELFLVGRTRVHLDDVERLGFFVELEVVLADGDTLAGGLAEARGLMEALGIPGGASVSKAYIDLLEGS